MSSQEPNEVSLPPIILLSSTEIAAHWQDTLQQKLEEQGLNKHAAKRITDEVVRLAPYLPTEPTSPRTASRTQVILGIMVLVTAIGSAIVTFLLHGSAVAYLIACVGALWGLVLFRYKL